MSYIGCTLHVVGTALQLAFKVPGFSELATSLGYGDYVLDEIFEN